MHTHCENFCIDTDKHETSFPTNRNIWRKLHFWKILRVCNVSCMLVMCIWRILAWGIAICSHGVSCVFIYTYYMCILYQRIDTLLMCDVTQYHSITGGRRSLINTASYQSRRFSKSSKLLVPSSISTFIHRRNSINNVNCLLGGIKIQNAHTTAILCIIYTMNLWKILIFIKLSLKDYVDTLVLEFLMYVIS
jgi:hypothetical protein